MYYKTNNYKPLKKEEILVIFQIQKILDKQEQIKDNNSNQFFLATKNQNLIVKTQQKSKQKTFSYKKKIMNKIAFQSQR